MSKAEKSAFEAADPGDYRQKRRIRRILDAKEHVTEIEKEVEYSLLLGQLDEKTANHALRRAIEHYIYEVESILKREEYVLDYWGGVAETEDGEAVWEGPFLGEMDLPDGSTREFYGLSQVVNCENPIVVEWSESAEGSWDGAESATYRDRVQIPRHILMAAFRLTNSFLSEINMDLEVEHGLPTFGFEELEDWDGEWLDDDTDIEEAPKA